VNSGFCLVLTLLVGCNSIQPIAEKHLNKIYDCRLNGRMFAFNSSDVSNLSDEKEAMIYEIVTLRGYKVHLVESNKRQIKCKKR